MLTFAILACLSADKRFWCGGVDPKNQGQLYAEEGGDDEKTAAYYEGTSKGQKGVMYDDDAGDRGLFYAKRGNALDYLPTFQLHGFFAFPDLDYLEEHEGQQEAFDAYVAYVWENVSAFVVASLWCLPVIALSSFAYTWKELLDETDELSEDRLLQEEDLRILEPASVERRRTRSSPAASWKRSAASCTPSSGCSAACAPLRTCGSSSPMRAPCRYRTTCWGPRGTSWRSTCRSWRPSRSTWPRA